MKKRLVFVLSVMSLSLAHAQLNNKIVIRGYLDSPKMVDSITLVIRKHHFGEKKKYQLIHKRIKLRLNHPAGYFEFMDTSSVPVHISIGQTTNIFNELDDRIISNYIAEPGDSITVFKFGGNDMYFHGKGKEKYECRLMLDKKTMFMNPFISDTTAQLSILHQYKDQLSDFAYHTLFLEIIGKKLMSVSTSILSSIEAKNKLPKDIWLRYQQLCQQIETGDMQAKLFSTEYLNSKILSAFIESKQSPIDSTPYQILKASTKGLLREKLLTGYLSLYYEKIDKADSLLSDALRIVENNDFMYQLTEIGNRLTKGSIAYDFSLPDEKGITRRLSEFKGKVVFIDFWFTGCNACIKYHKEVLQPLLLIYGNHPDIVFITISIDDTREKWLNTIKGGLYTAEGYINLHTNGMGADHPVIKQFYVYSYPRPLLIDKKGKIFATSAKELVTNPAKLKKTIEDALAQEN